VSRWHTAKANAGTLFILMRRKDRPAQRFTKVACWKAIDARCDEVHCKARSLFNEEPMASGRYMSEEPNRIARDAYLVMRAVKDAELRTFRNALAEWPDNRQANMREGIAELANVLESQIAVLDKLIAAWDVAARQRLMR
jgi:hypothetical protein